MSVDIAVIDYGMGNLRSVSKAIEHVAPAASVVVTSDPAVIADAGRVVFPGQGAVPDCMREIDARGLRQAIVDAARNKPFLGICMGLQVLFEHSEEGDTAVSGHPARHGGALSARGDARRAGQQTESAAHGLEPGSSGEPRTRCGRASRKARASISCTATMCSRLRPR